MTTDQYNSPARLQLIEYGKRIKQWQDDHRLSNADMVRKFPGLGSTKTFARVTTGQLWQLNLDTQVERFASVVALIEDSLTSVNEEVILDDLTGPLEIRRAFFETMASSSNARVIVIEGDTGTGKSTTARSLARKYGEQIVYIEASVSWGDKVQSLYGALLIALGRTDLPTHTETRKAAVLERLGRARRAVVIDEAHHMGPRTLSEVKTLVNQSPTVFILAAMGTLWRRLERDQYQEVKQLTGNRLAERIILTLRESDIAKMIERRVAPGNWAATAKALFRHAGAHGNLAFVRNVINRAIAQRDAARGPSKDPIAVKDDITHEDMIDSMNVELARRGA